MMSSAGRVKSALEFGVRHQRALGAPIAPACRHPIKVHQPENAVLDSADADQERPPYRAPLWAFIARRRYVLARPRSEWCFRQAPGIDLIRLRIVA